MTEHSDDDFVALTSEVENLKAALHNSRRIGIALGIIVERDRITIDQAFEVLREASQRTNRKLRDLADDVIESGVIPHPE
jgi:AmiR/NasT family two-component response regulator